MSGPIQLPFLTSASGFSGVNEAQTGVKDGKGDGFSLLLSQQIGPSGLNPNQANISGRQSAGLASAGKLLPADGNNLPAVNAVSDDSTSLDNHLGGLSTRLLSELSNKFELGDLDEDLESSSLTPFNFQTIGLQISEAVGHRSLTSAVSESITSALQANQSASIGLLGGANAGAPGVGAAYHSPPTSPVASPGASGAVNLIGSGAQATLQGVDGSASTLLQNVSGSVLAAVGEPIGNASSTPSLAGQYAFDRSSPLEGFKPITLAQGTNGRVTFGANALDSAAPPSVTPTSRQASLAESLNAATQLYPASQPSIQSSNIAAKQANGTANVNDANALATNSERLLGEAERIIAKGSTDGRGISGSLAEGGHIGRSPTSASDAGPAPNRLPSSADAVASANGFKSNASNGLANSFSATNELLPREALQESRGVQASRALLTDSTQQHSSSINSVLGAAPSLANLTDSAAPLQSSLPISLANSPVQGGLELQGSRQASRSLSLDKAMTLEIGQGDGTSRGVDTAADSVPRPVTMPSAASNLFGSTTLANTTVATGSFALNLAEANAMVANSVPQLGQRIQWMLGSGTQVAEIRLDPPELGPLQIQVSSDEKQASVNFLTQNAAAKELIEANLPRLREHLESLGLELGEATVGQHENQSNTDSSLADEGSESTSAGSENDRLDSVSGDVADGESLSAEGIDAYV